MASGDHPRVLVTQGDRDAVRAKIAKAPWAREAYAGVKKNVDRYADLCASDPKYLTSRLMMNWETHYTQAIVERDKFVRGEGHAPIPTPRFAGERDWATHFMLPGSIEEYRPYNDSPDKSGKVWMFNRDTNQAGWTDPTPTGQCIETANRRLMELAADAAFVYWITGDEHYARMGSDVLWTFLDGFQYVQPPHDLGRRNQIIGSMTFEVIHEITMQSMGLAYDFLAEYMSRQGKDLGLMQAQMQRLCDRVIDGGSAEGNWNLNQCMNFVYPGLAMEDNAAYANHEGRQYYVDVLLNARLPAQKGIVHVIKEGYDQETALWPEAPGYGFGATPQMILFASLLSNDPEGKALLDDPFLTRAVLAQLELIYPNGYSVGLGDTNNATISAQALELLIASARKRGDRATETRLTTALQREIAGGRYTRGKQSDLLALTHYVDDLIPVSSTNIDLPRTYFGAPLNILVQRSPAADAEHALAAAMYGTKGGHVHANGLAIELFGAGFIQGADPGRGQSYWTADHHEYYSQPPAHNTVIVNGRSTYAENAKPQHAMTLTHLEPASGAPALSPTVSFATGTFHYQEAEQQRTLAVVRTGPKSGFYFDVFRSRAKDEAGSFHDYVYHNMGQSLEIKDGTGQSLPLAPSTRLTSGNGCSKGYDYFKSERSAASAGDFHGVFSTALPTDSPRFMGLWMPGQPDRQIFVVDGPANHAVREALPKEFGTILMPTLVVRQQGDAWKQRPFVAVYEPYLGVDGPSIHTVRAATVEGDSGGLAACRVEGNGFRVTLLQSDDPTRVNKIESAIDFQGDFGAILSRGDAIDEVYLGSGHSLGTGNVFIKAIDPVSASMRRQGSEWRVSTNGPIRAGMTFPLPAGVSSANELSVKMRDLRGPIVVAGSITARVDSSTPGKHEVIVTCDLPAGTDMVISLTR